MQATQKHRFISIKTGLGPDKLLIHRFSMSESLGRLFQMDIELYSDDHSVKFEDIVGTNATVELDMPNGKKRYFNGLVSRFVQDEHERTYAVYRATLVPWLWMLTRTSDCRIFQKKKVPDIIEEVFKGHGFKDYKLKLSGTYCEWDYCVQYRETDFNFVSRLMEQEGIYYFFEHKDGSHNLILADAPSAHETFEGYDTLTYRPPTTKQEEMTETVTDWVIEKEVKPGNYVLGDYNFKTPRNKLRVNSNVSRQHEKADFEIFDYPGVYGKRDEGEHYVKVRIQELQAQHEILRAQATVRGVSTGSKFTLKGHTRKDQNREYLISGASYEITTGAYEAGAGDAGSEFYSCNFTAMPATEPFRAVRLTPKPVIQGPQTAMVVGPSGETIHTDEYGRIKVQFHWDRYAKGDDNSSCWIRVSQPWGGKNWGGMFIPHVGQEVVVLFEEGDPDRPLVAGRVYNPDQMPPLPLPANKTKSAIRDHGGNEIIMEGAGGKQQIRLHSPTHDTTMTLGNSFNLHTLSHFISEVLGNHDEKIGGTEKKEVKGESKEKTYGARNEKFFGLKKEFVGAMTMSTFVGASYESKKAIQISSTKGYKFETDSSTKYELNKADSKKKAPTFKEHITQVKSVLGDVVRQVRGQHAIKGAKKLYQQAKELEIMGDNGLTKVKDYKVKCAQLREEAKEKIAQFKKLKTESELFTLLAKLEVNDGAFKVSK